MSLVWRSEKIKRNKRGCFKFLSLLKDVNFNLTFTVQEQLSAVIMINVYDQSTALKVEWAIKILAEHLDYIQALLKTWRNNFFLLVFDSIFFCSRGNEKLCGNRDDVEAIPLRPNQPNNKVKDRKSVYLKANKVPSRFHVLTHLKIFPISVNRIYV